MALYIGIHIVLLFVIICAASAQVDNNGTGSDDSGRNISGSSVIVSRIISSNSTITSTSSDAVSTATNTTTTTTTTASSASATTSITTSTDACASVVCQHGGTCVKGICFCLSGYIGDWCQTAIEAMPIIIAETVMPLRASASTTSATTTAITTSKPKTSSATTTTTSKTSSAIDHRPVSNNTNANGTIGNGTKHTGSGDVINNATHIDKNDDVGSKDEVMTSTVAPSPCHSAPCQNGAICEAIGDSFTCECNLFYTGLMCETAICSEAYLHSPANGQKSCSHQPESSDITCDLTCNPGHYFADRQHTHVHDCTDGLWLPSEKEVANCYRVDYCVNVTCLHNGTCKELWKDATCSCLPGYAGDMCEIDIDECASSPCINDGKCVDGSNKFQCICPVNYGGYHCETEILQAPVLTGVTPEYGPQAGGTFLTITGEELHVPSEYIHLYLSDLKISEELMETKLCKVIKSNATHIIAETPEAEDDLLRRYLPLAVQLAGGGVYSSRLYFQYKPNPRITLIEPMDAIIAGGTSLTISGSSLDSVAVPVVHVTMVATWRTPIAVGQVVTNKVKTVFAQPCDVPSASMKTKRICRMPQLEVIDEFLLVSNLSENTSRNQRDIRQLQRQVKKISTNLKRTYNDNGFEVHRKTPTDHRRSMRTEYRHRIRHEHAKNHIRPKREQSYTNSNTTELRFFLGFQLDGVETYSNISAVPELVEYGMLAVHKGPVLYSKDSPIRFKELKDGQLLIEGSRLLQGVRMTDYAITIGSELCMIQDMTNVTILCKAPEEQPEDLPDSENDHPIIMVNIGTNIQVTYGMLQYPSNIWIIIGPILGVVVVIIAILIALFVIRRRLRANHKRRKHQQKYHYRQGEMIRLPSVRRDEFEDALQVPGEGSDNLLAFHEDPALGAFHDEEPQSPSHSGGSSLLTSADEFDGPEEFYENKDTIKKQQSHEAALEQFTGNVRHSGPRYTAEPQNRRVSNSLLPNKGVPTRTAAKPRAKDPESELGPANQSPFPSLRSFQSESSAGNSSKPSQPVQEDIYVNNAVEPSIGNGDQDIYENTNVQHDTPKKKKKKKDKVLRPHAPVALPPVPSTRQQASDTPPPVPNTPRPKLNITPKYRGSNGQQPNYKHKTISHPFEENHYTNARTGDSDDDDIYVNSPIKSGRLRSSGGRGRPGRSRSTRRYNDDRGDTMWY